jgi:hypothetical protein
MTDSVHVIVESECSEADQVAIAQVFTSAGIPVEIDPAYARRSAGILPWLIQIETSLGHLVSYLLAGAAGGATGAAGADGWAALKGLTSRLRNARATSEGDITIKEAESETEILLSAELPDEAYQRLLELEATHDSQPGILKWDREQLAWIDPLTGYLHCRYPGCVEPATEGRERQHSPATIERREFCDVHAAAADLGDEMAWE